MTKLQDIDPGTVFETADGRRYVKADHLDRSKKAQGQWECISLDDGSHPKAFPEVNHEEVTPISYFDAGPVEHLFETEINDGTIIEVIGVSNDDFKSLVGHRLIATWTPSTNTMAANFQRRHWVSLTDGQPYGLIDLDSRVRVLYHALDPKTAGAHEELADLKDDQKDAKEALGALKSRLDGAFGPLGLTDPDSAEELLQSVMDVLGGMLETGGLFARES